MEVWKRKGHNGIRDTMASNTHDTAAWLGWTDINQTVGTGLAGLDGMQRGTPRGRHACMFAEPDNKRRPPPRLNLIGLQIKLVY